MKKIISFIVAIMMLASLSTSAFAAEVSSDAAIQCVTNYTV